MNAQAITGQIIGESNEGVGFANVIIRDSVSNLLIKGDITDVDGRFSFYNLQAGQYILEASMLGYKTVSKVVSSNQDNVVLVLTEDAQLLDAVTIVEKLPVYERQMDRVVVNVKNAVSSTGVNAMEIVQRSPGVIVDRASSNISIVGRDGTMIAINGKISRLDGDALVQFLSSMPSDNIEKIEIITNPPSSYDAQGNAGIINIVLSKNEYSGLNGNVSLTGGYGQRGKYGGSANVNYLKGGFNVYGGLTTNNDYTVHNLSFSQNINYSQGSVNTSQFNERPPYIGLHSFKLGLDYAFNKRLSVSSFVEASKRVWKMTAKSTTENLNDNSLIDLEILESVESNISEDYIISNNLTYNIDDDKSLSIDYDYLKYNISNPTAYDLKQFSNNDIVDDKTFMSTKETPFDFNVMRLDYSSKIGKMNAVVGYKATLSNVENITSLINIVDDVQVVDDFFTDDIVLNEDTHAFYVSMEGNLFEHTTFSGGLRYENTQSDLYSNKSELIFDREISRLFPTLNLEFLLSEENKISVSYNERINRPSFQVLAPAFYFFDTNTVLGGNINALPTISQNLSVGLSLGIYNLTIGYTDEDNPLAWGQVDLNEDREILILRRSNGIDRKLYFTSFDVPINVKDYWTMRFNINGLIRVEKPLVDGNVLTRSSFVSYGTFSSLFKIGKSIETELSSTWNSKVNVGIANFQPRVSFNLGISKKFKNNSKLAISWSDLFNTGSFFELLTEGVDPNVNYNWNYQLEGNVVKLTYSYPFGQKGDKQSRDREAVSQDIRSRANN